MQFTNGGNKKDLFLFLLLEMTGTTVLIFDCRRAIVVSNLVSNFLSVFVLGGTVVSLLPFD